jgi:hypothetical protein
MRALPNDGRDVGLVVNNSPKMDFQVRLNTTGTHHLWVRGYAESFFDASVIVGIDGQPTRLGNITFSPTGDYAWGNDSNDGPDARLTVPTPGEHLVTVWMSQDGFILDKILLTTDGSFVPDGFGPSESPRATMIGLSRSGNQLTLSWSASGYVLQENADLSNPAGWTNVVNGGTSPVIVNISAAQKFYRLRQ